MTDTQLGRWDYLAATALLASLVGAVATLLHVLRLIWPGRK